MIPRYARPKMAAIWQDENRYRIWLRIEILACEAYARLGRVPEQSLQNIRQHASFSLERIETLEAMTRHDVIAFLSAVGETVGDDARYLHMGMTSSDVLDTCFAVQLVEATDLIVSGVDGLREEVRRKAWEHKHTLMVGRTHGVHAEPITFGLKFAVWYEELGRNRERLLQARNAVAVGKLSGAVGTYATIPPVIESYVCDQLGLKPDPVSTQIIQRDRHAQFFAALAILASSLEKFALEIRHLQRTEVRELEEPFAKGQKGSSAMPHKRNPVLTENICGLARVVRSYALASMENVPLWHERDISHSSAERIIAPDSTVLIDFMLHRLCSVISGLQVHAERMLENLLATRGLLFSQELLLRLVEKGMSRETAYQIVQEHAMQAWDGGENLRSRIQNDTRITGVLAQSEIDDVFRWERYLQHVDQIFKRVFGSEPPH